MNVKVSWLIVVENTFEQVKLCLLLLFGEVIFNKIGSARNYIYARSIHV